MNGKGDNKSKLYEGTSRFSDSTTCFSLAIVLKRLSQFFTCGNFFPCCTHSDLKIYFMIKLLQLFISSSIGVLSKLEENRETKPI